MKISAQIKLTIVSAEGGTNNKRYRTVWTAYDVSWRFLPIDFIDCSCSTWMTYNVRICLLRVGSLHLSEEVGLRAATNIVTNVAFLVSMRCDIHVCSNGAVGHRGTPWLVRSGPEWGVCTDGLTTLREYPQQGNNWNNICAVLGLLSCELSYPAEYLFVSGNTIVSIVSEGGKLVLFNVNKVRKCSVSPLPYTYLLVTMISSL